jgi:hypothetical protein
MRQACDEAASERVGRQRKDDGDDRCRLLYCGDGASDGDNHVDFEADKLGGDLGVAFGASFRPAILDRNGATLDPTQFTHSRHKSSRPWTEGRSICAQETDGRQLFRLLRERGERLCDCRAAEIFNNLWRARPKADQTRL